MRPLRGCSGITRLACTQPWATSAPSSLNSSGIEQRKQAMEKQESKIRFPTFPQPLRLRTITSYGIRILRARSQALHCAHYKFIDAVVSLFEVVTNRFQLPFREVNLLTCEHRFR